MRVAVDRRRSAITALAGGNRAELADLFLKRRRLNWPVAAYFRCDTVVLVIGVLTGRRP